MNRKLNLNRETVRRLDPAHLLQVVGGALCSTGPLSAADGTQGGAPSVCVCIEDPPSGACESDGCRPGISNFDTCYTTGYCG